MTISIFWITLLCTYVVSLVPGSWISEKDTLNIEVRVENYGISVNFTVYCEIYRITKHR